MRIHARRHYRHDISAEIVTVICLAAIVAGIVIGLGGGIISLLSSDDAYTRCIVLHSHDTCAYTLR